jgi:uncharacterized membrane protein YhaH (DUF805 family)
MTPHAHAALAPPVLRYGPDKTLTLFFEDFTKFKGFATRPEFWWPFVLILTLHLAIATTGSVVIATRFTDDLVTDGHNLFGLNSVVSVPGIEGAGAIFALALVSLHLLIGAVTLLPLIAVSWRRLHDTGLPGSMFFLGFIPAIGGVVVLLLLARHSAPERHHAEWSDTQT